MSTTTAEVQPNAQVFQYSVKLESTAKGLVMPTVHVYSNDMETARYQAVQQYATLLEDLKARGIQTASEGVKA